MSNQKTAVLYSVYLPTEVSRKEELELLQRVFKEGYNTVVEEEGTDEEVWLVKEPEEEVAALQHLPYEDLQEGLKEKGYTEVSLTDFK